MGNLLTIKKNNEDSFYLVEYDPRRPDDELTHKIQGSFSKCGLLVDRQSHTMLKAGNYDMVFKIFKQTEEAYTNAGLYDMADALRIYDISSMSAEDVDKILKISTIAESLLKKYPNLPFVQGSSFDECEIIS